MIRFPTARPQALLNAFDKAIKDGDITTWAKDGDGDYFHKASQWTKRAWLRSTVVPAKALEFSVIFKDNETEMRAVYAFHSTRIVETFINHFSDKFTSNAQVTPNASDDEEDF